MARVDQRGVGRTAWDASHPLRLGTGRWPSAEVGVWCLDEGPWTIRLVTHLDVSEADVEEAGELTAAVVERLAG